MSETACWDVETRKDLFPVDSIDALLNYLNFEIGQDSPYLALASIIIGFYETQLTDRYRRSNSPVPSDEANNDKLSKSQSHQSSFPIMTFSDAFELVEKFRKMFEDQNSESASLSEGETEITRLSDLLWDYLPSRGSRERPHCQFLYALLRNEQLDAFGFCFAIASAAQMRSRDDIHLCLSEDHSWVAYDIEGELRHIEVAWHGKFGDERRGQLIHGQQMRGSWIYADGKPLMCKNRKMELVCLINAINPVVETGVDCFELLYIQQKLLSKLMEESLLDIYPVALATLANTHELIYPDSNESSKIFQRAIMSARNNFMNRHVYPYTFYGGFLLRASCLRAAVWCWAESAKVLSSYCYQRDDEEVYKEMYDFAVDTLPNLLKSNGDEVSVFIQDPLSFVLLLNFYDGLCSWEEGSQTPVVHITWGRAIYACLSKFSIKVRRSIKYFMDRKPVENVSLPNNLSETEKVALEFLSATTSMILQINGQLGVFFESEKMNAIKDLLAAEKMRPDGIQLQLTAQTSASKVTNRTSLPESVTSVESDESQPCQRTSKRRRNATNQ